jgi:hypothetical protein
VKRFLAITLTALFLTGVVAPQTHAASPVPGRFCKSADIGTKVKTSRYGIVVCKQDGIRARWKRA